MKPVVRMRIVPMFGEPIRRDGDGLAWELRGSGVKCLSEDGMVRADGSIAIPAILQPYFHAERISA